MKKTIIITILLILLLLTGCTGITPQPSANAQKTQNQHSYDLKVYTACNDGVICYWHPEGYAGGLSCFDNNPELITKYCQ